MRITAKEAKAKADAYTSKESCLECILEKIQEAAEKGYYNVVFYKNAHFAKLSKLFEEEHFEYVKENLENLGFKTELDPTAFSVEWK